MDFKEALQKDLQNVFHNAAEFAEPLTVYYDGEKYEKVPVVITGTAQDRKRAANEHDQGLFIDAVKAFIKLTDLGGNMPRKNHMIQIAETEYNIITAAEDFGEIILTLEAIEE